jgi:hypothetical protein
MTANSNLTVYKASINSETGSIVSTNRTWKRDIALSIQASAARAIPTNGLSLWLKADHGVTINNSNVTAWIDQSGNNNNASVENIGEEPTFQSSFSNSKPAIQFNGTQLLQILDSNTLDFLKTSIFIVLKRTGNGTGNEVTFMKNASNIDGVASYWQLARSGEFGNSYFTIASQGNHPDQDSSVNIEDGIPKIMGFIYNATTFNIYVNGTQTATYGFPTGNINTTSGTLQIGGYNKSFNNPEGELFNGQIAEIIMYNRAITTAERQQIEIYLNSKYIIY